MFEEICLVCSKHLTEDGRAYCSDDCQNEDLSSSSSSSALSSPSIAYAVGGDVPALALGSALKMYAGRTYASSVSTDDEDFCLDDDASSSSKFYTSGLSYARRPSGTNNHSTVPRLQHRRLSSGSAAGLVHGVPRSAPLMCRPALNDDDDSFSFDFLDDDLLSESSPARHPPLPSRSRNRASLPACFSLLKMHTTTATSSPAHTVSRQSPPTPRLPLAQRPASIPPPQAVHATPRGRRREAGASTSRRRADSRARTARPEELHGGDSCSPADFPRRGRAPTRRNSSPPPTAAVLLHASSERERTRGRARIAELSPDAPGFGTGRSGLVHRERAAAAGRVAL